MAEERRAREHPGKALAEVGKESHACHGIRREIQKMEAVSVHDVVEEVRERGAEPAREVIDEEGVPIWAVLGKIGGDDTCGRVPVVYLPHSGKKFLRWTTSTVDGK